MKIVLRTVSTASFFSLKLSITVVTAASKTFECMRDEEKRRTVFKECETLYTTKEKEVEDESSAISSTHCLVGILLRGSSLGHCYNEGYHTSRSSVFREHLTLYHRHEAMCM